VPEIVESGGATWSSRPLGEFPGDPTPHLMIRLRVSDERAVNRRQLDEFVAAIRPAHVPCTIEVVTDRADTSPAADVWTPPAEPN
jgi:hypothetical protein